MKVYPDSALVQLEFDKIKELLHENAAPNTPDKALDLRIHTRKISLNESLNRLMSLGNWYKMLFISRTITC
jgi:DNA mismatch repair protein MutS2